jgi:ABC-type multidrug transport system fused ATPase/permease subunit
VAQAVGFNALAVVADAAVPLLIATALNHLAAGGHNWHWFIVPGIAVCLLQVLGLLGWNHGIKGVWRLEIRVGRDLSEQTFAHIADQSEQFHLDNFGGALVSDQTKFISSYIRLLDEGIFSYFTSLVTIVFIIVALVWTLWWFVLALTLMSCLYMLVGLRSRRREIPQSQTTAQSHSRQTAQIADTVTNIATVRGFGREFHEDGLYRGRTNRYVSEESELMRLNMGGFLASEAINRLALVHRAVDLTRRGARVERAGRHHPDCRHLHAVAAQSPAPGAALAQERRQGARRRALDDDDPGDGGDRPGCPAPATVPADRRRRRVRPRRLRLPRGVSGCSRTSTSRSGPGSESGWSAPPARAKPRCRS